MRIKRKEETEIEIQLRRQKAKERMRIKRKEETENEIQLRRQKDKDSKQKKRDEERKCQLETAEQIQIRRQKYRKQKHLHRLDPEVKKRENKNRKKWDLRTRHNELYDQKNKRRKLTNEYYQEKREEGLLESTSNYHLRKKREHPRPYRHRSNGSKTIVELKNLNSKYIKNVLRNDTELDVLF